jgi:outer membrane protein
LKNVLLVLLFIILVSPPLIRGDETLELSVRDAVLLALEQNSSLAVERLKPAISKTYVNEERGAFNPEISGALSLSGGESSAGAELTAPLPTGTELQGGVDASTGDDVSLGFTIGIAQELLKDRRRDVNLAQVRQAELENFSSEYELRGFTEALVAAVETAYWDLFSAELQIEIYHEGMLLAEQQLSEINERINVGTIPAIELIAARAEVALRREALLDAESRRENALLRLLNLVNPPGKNPWETRIVTKDRPQTPPAEIDDLETHLESALRMRPDLNQARLALKRGELEIVQTRNGLLPRLALFIGLGKTGYAESFSGAATDLAENGFDFSASISFSHPIGNRAARSRHERSLLSSQLAESALANLKRLVELDVRSAYIDVRRTRKQIDATMESRSLQEEKLSAEMEKFRVGRSTALIVAQAQRDLLNSRIAEEEALISHLRSLIDLHRVDGSLLLRRGVSVPGELPASSVQQ